MSRISLQGVTARREQAALGQHGGDLPAWSKPALFAVNVQNAFALVVEVDALGLAPRQTGARAIRNGQARWCASVFSRYLGMAATNSAIQLSLCQVGVGFISKGASLVNIHFSP